jgi:hypothetical protein
VATASIGWADRVRSVYIDPTMARLFVLVLGLSVFAVKVWVAVHTYGTNDIHTFMGFAHGVHERGPVGIYSIDYRAGPHHWLYNHPPLIGYFLQFINVLSEHGIPLRVTLRTVSSAADVISGLVIYEVLRRRISLLKATLCGAAVAASPLLFLISGYHGNTDPIFLMLALLGSFLIIDESQGLWGGIALGLAVGTKIVAFVALPALAAYLVVHRRKDLRGAAMGFAVTVGATWGPAVIREWGPLRHNVLGYTGVGDRVWGLVRIADKAGWPAVRHFLMGPGVHLIPLMCALLPALVAWRAADKAMEAVALSLVATLVFLPAYGIQYFSWGVAAAYLLAPLPATLYNLLGGFIVFRVYDQWNHGVWTKMARGEPITPQMVGLMALLWAALAAVLFTGVRQALSPPGSRSTTGTAEEAPARAHPRGLSSRRRAGARASVRR